MASALIGRVVLLVIDVQVGDDPPSIPLMSHDGFIERMLQVVTAARSAGIPLVHFQEIHRKEMVDYGRELEGTEGVHCLEGTPGVAIRPEFTPLPGEYFIPKRRYSGFFGTDLEILLKGLKAETLVLIGGLTDVCVHYTAADAHQHDYRVRVVEDAVIGSSWPAHEAALDAIEYLQTGARMTAASIGAAFREHAGVHGIPSPVLAG